jgi:hypothetical protein
MNHSLTVPELTISKCKLTPTKGCLHAHCGALCRIRIRIGPDSIGSADPDPDRPKSPKKGKNEKKSCLNRFVWFERHMPVFDKKKVQIVILLKI